MIEKINIGGRATFGEKASIESLGKINIFYGHNGSGKTTISRTFLESPERMVGPRDSYHAAVYNKKYVENNFKQNSAIPGVITLGFGRIEDKTKFDENKKLINEKINLKSNELKYTNRLDSLIKLLENKKVDLVWEKIQEIKKDENLSVFFNGIKASKTHAYAEVVKFLKSEHDSFVSIEELHSYLEKIPKEDKKEISELSIPSYPQINKEVEGLLSKVIVGNNDSTLSDFYSFLENSDWVNEGLRYFDITKSDDNTWSCPFCKSSLSEDLVLQIKEYFNESYNNDLQSINSIKDIYKECSKNTIVKLDGILGNQDEYIDISLLKTLRYRLEKIYQQNLNLLEQKCSKPSLEINLIDASGVEREISDFITKKNDEIREINEIIKNKNEQFSLLKPKIWETIFGTLRNRFINEDRSINSIKRKQKPYIKSINKLELQISNLEKENKVISDKGNGIKFVCEKINSFLDSRGIKSFKLRCRADNLSYDVIRENGELVSDSLSEGEKNFLTFLYFYFSIKEYVDRERTENFDVIVIDDPISSLDDEMLYTVASLTDNIISDVIEGGSEQQLFILTHNSRYLYEVSETLRHKKIKDIHYYMISKVINNSTVEALRNVPVTSNYRHLWYRLMKYKMEIENNYSTTDEYFGLQNLMRRIVEYYFNFLGRSSAKKLLAENSSRLTHDENVLLDDFLRWMNAGSHSSEIEKISMAITKDSALKHFEAFELLFNKLGHKEHYDMMFSDFGKHVEK